MSAVCPREMAVHGRNVMRCGHVRDSQQQLGPKSVVVGYGTQKESESYGAVAAVGAEKLENQPHQFRHTDASMRYA